MNINQLHELFLKSSGVNTDTRSIKTDELFFALKGENFNGNKFAEQAIKAGAKFAVIDESEYEIAGSTILVNDVLKVLQELANFHRETFTIPFIGITGSNGKTTSKELITEVLNQKFNVLATKGNLNNHIGVPLTLLELNSSHEIAVIEMGANKPGDIHELCEIANPDYGIITNIGRAHLEGFGSLEGVANTKSELYRWVFDKEGLVFVNALDELLMRMSSRFPKRQVFGGEDFPLKQLSADPYVNIGLHEKKEATQLVGDYNFTNMCAAYSIGQYFGVPEEGIFEALVNYFPTNNRSQVVEKDGVTWIMDAYNANPSSMKAAIENFARFPSSNKLVILGDMFELGNEAESAHKEMVDLCEKSGFQLCFFCGELFNGVKKVSKTLMFYEDTASLKNELSEFLGAGSVVLVKGSRGMKLEDLLMDVD